MHASHTAGVMSMAVRRLHSASLRACSRHGPRPGRVTPPPPPPPAPRESPSLPPLPPTPARPWWQRNFVFGVPWRIAERNRQLPEEEFRKLHADHTSKPVFDKYMLIYFAVTSTLAAGAYYVFEFRPNRSSHPLVQQALQSLRDTLPFELLGESSNEVLAGALS